MSVTAVEKGVGAAAHMSGARGQMSDADSSEPGLKARAFITPFSFSFLEKSQHGKLGKEE